jgi:glycosyltransferase involved in cell wall biosynthesis
LLEAFAAGKPVIGARIGGIPEMIDEGVNGFLFEPGNVAELASMIERFIMLDPVILDRMGRSARLKIEEAYSAETHCAGLLALYHDVIKSRVHPARS